MPSTVTIRGTFTIARMLGEGAPGHNSTARRPTPAIDDLSFSHTPSGITLAVDPGLTGSTVQASPSLPVDMWTIGQSPNGCASHAYRARKGAESVEMLAFAHIPTGNRHNKEEFIF